MACEIICADSGRFIETMRRNTNIISPLWSFLRKIKLHRKNSQIINTCVTGDSPSSIQNGAIFFSRLNIFLFTKMLSTMINFLDERVPDALDLLVENLDLQPINELLYRFYALGKIESDSQGNVDVIEWLRDGGFHDKLADQLLISKGTDLHMAVAHFITGLFSLPFSENFPRDRIIKPFLSRSWLYRLLGNIFNNEAEESFNGSEFELEDCKQSSLIHGIEIITEILKFSREVFVGNSVDSFVSGLMENFETFFDILKQKPMKFSLELSTGKVEVFGRVRLGVAGMFAEVLNSLPQTKQCEIFVKKIKDFELIPTLLDSFFIYRQNNFLHQIVVRQIGIIFESPEKFDSLITQILTDYSFRQKIVQFQKENDAHVERPRGNRLPFMGHLTQISESIVKWEMNNNKMTTCRFIVSDVNDEPWREYCNKTLKETKLRDKKILGGIKPPKSFDEMLSNSDDEILDYNAVFRSGNEEQMARYFCQQIIGNLPEQFLYANGGNYSGSSSEDYDSDDDNDFDFVFETSKHNKKREKSTKKSIEIPLLMAQDDFDEEMFDSSFTSSLLSDSDESSSETETESESDDYYDDDY